MPNIAGWADYYPLGQRGDRWIHGELANGLLLGNHLHFLVHWKNGQTGVYDADIDGSGNFINGKTIDFNHPESTATWTANTKVVCSPGER
jgi:hypothetical protein